MAMWVLYFYNIAKKLKDYKYYVQLLIAVFYFYWKCPWMLLE